jgi:hypothetical protein
MDASAASGYSCGIELITKVDQPGTTGTEIDHESKRVVRAATRVARKPLTAHGHRDSLRKRIRRSLKISTA